MSSKCHQRALRGSSEGHQNVIRGSSEGHQRALSASLLTDERLNLILFALPRRCESLPRLARSSTAQERRRERELGFHRRGL